MAGRRQAPKAENELANNVRRLLGLHSLRATRDAGLIGISPQALSEIQYGTRASVSLSTMEKLSGFFEIPIDRLLHAQFEELLQAEVADSERYRRVEAKKQPLPPRRKRS